MTYSSTAFEPGLVASNSDAASSALAEANAASSVAAGKAEANQTMYIGTTAVAINRTTAALTLAGITLTTPNLGTPSALVGTNISGTASGLDIGGNAATATALATAQNIAGQSFDGTANITIASTDLSDTSNVAYLDQANTFTNASPVTLKRTVTNLKLTINNTSANGEIWSLNSAASGRFIIGHATLNMLGIDNTGNVGIGVTDPHSKLEVNGAISSGFATITASSDTTDVSGINTLFINPGAAVVIGAFVGGVTGQHLKVVIVDADQDVTLEHNEGTGNQNIFMHKGSDETLGSEYGGWNLVCDGTSWFDVSHAAHV